MRIKYYVSSIKNLSWHSVLCLAICIFYINISTAQQNLPLGRDWNFLIGRESIKLKTSDSLGVLQITEIKYQENESSFYPTIQPYQIHQIKDKSKKLLLRKIKKESLFIIKDTADKFYMTIDPLFNFEFGKDLQDKTGEKLYKNTRGFIVRGNIGKKIAFESNFYENQATYAQYIDDYVFSTNKLFPQTANYQYDVIPGQGRAKKFKNNGYDYAMASGYVSYSPYKVLNIQLGHGKHFVGDGYRSLLLSDNGFNYPFARITTTYKNIQYTNLYTSFMNLTDGGVKTPPGVERLFQKKTASFQMLSMNFFKKLQIGLFQGMIWEAADSTNRQHFSFNTFNPVIGVNTAVYGLHHTNNVLLGATLKFKITKSIQLYGQYMLDDIYQQNNLGNIRKKYGYQIGFKYFDLFTVKNLHLQLEYNNVRPYAYSASNTYQSYTHYNQSLAHPLGANFYEAVGFINYKLKDFFIQLKGNYAVKGLDSLGNNFGGNVFKADNIFPSSQNVNDIQTTQGLKTTIMYQDIQLGYLVNPATNFNIVIGFINRAEQNSKTNKQMQFVYVGLRTSLANFYYDF